MSWTQRRLINSLYLCLLLSVACLGYAEIGQKLPETPFVYGSLLIALVIAYRCEGRFALSIGLSNTIAGVVVLVGGFWLALNLGRQFPDMDSPYALPRTLVSGAGPIMCFLLLAKLFRPKGVSDLWMLHLLGLVQVILACVLAMGSRMDRDAPLFPILLLTYLAVEAWAQRRFYLDREANFNPITAAPPPRRFTLRPVGLFLASLLLAVVIFFSLPLGGLDASIFRGTDATETGASQHMDLNAEGDVQVSDEQVMRIWASRAPGENLILPETFRLRGAVLSNYGERPGEWTPFPFPSITPLLVARETEPTRGRGIRFEYDIDITKTQELGRPRVRGGTDLTSVPLFLPDPPANDFNDRTFRVPAHLGEDNPLHANTFEGLTWLTLKRRTNTVHLFQQYTGSYNNREWEQVLSVLPFEYDGYKNVLLRIPARITASGRIDALTKSVLAWAKLTDNAPVKDKALALERYLSSTGYVYTLERRKQDTTIDPTEDFLINVKQGHCERFASALAIMLRTLGIPSRVVVGYRGAEWNEIGGFNVIRQLHAHAWVEALIGEQVLPGGGKRLRWLSLDPSPLGEAATTNSVITSPLGFARFLWEFFILDFSGQAQRARLMTLLQGTYLGRLIEWWKTLTWWQAVIFVAAVLAFATAAGWGLSRLLRRLRRGRKNRRDARFFSVPFFDRLLRVLSRRGWTPAVGQTAAEFARAVRPHLASHPDTSTVAAVPEAVVSPFYDLRYGGRPLSDQQTTQVNTQLDALQKALT